MSNISDDKKVLKKRKSLKGVEETSLRHQIVKKLYDKVIDLNLQHRIREAWYTESANVQAMLERQQVYVRDADEFLPASADSPSGGSSNLHIPMPHIVSKAYTARFMDAVWGIDPPFSLKARREDSTDKVNLIEEFLRYTLYNWTNHYDGAEEALEMWIDSWVKTGTGIMKLRWANEYCSFVDVEEVAKQGPPQFEVDSEGREVAIPTVVTEEKEVTKTINKFQGPVMEVVPLEDFIMVGGEGNPDKADLVIHRYYLTASDLWSGVDQGVFDQDAVESIIKGGDDRESAGINNEVKIQRSFNAGKSSLDSENDRDRYEILESYVKADVDGTGVASDIVVWISPRCSKPLRTTYLYRIMPTGERPFSVAHFQKRQGQEYGVGLLELLHPLSVELDAIHNIRLDFGMITNNPTFFYRASSSMEADKLQLEPGMGIPLDNPQQDVFFPQRPNSTGFFGNEEQVIQTYIERLTGISDLSLGAMSGSQGAARTATGARALMNESNTNLNVHLRHINRAWKKLLRMLFHLLQLRIDGEVVFRVTGQDGSSIFKKITNYDMTIDVDFELSSNSSNSNKAVQIEIAQQLIGLVSNPLYLQLGITGPGQVYEAIKAYMNALGVKDVHKYIQKPQGYDYVPSPEEIFNRAVRGQDIKPNPLMDVDGTIAFFETMIEQQNKAQFITEDQLRAAIMTLRQFQQLKQAMDQQAAQAAAQQQMAINSASSQQQAPVALNPLAGSNPGELPIA